MKKSLVFAFFAFFLSLILTACVGGKIKFPFGKIKLP